MSPEKKVLSLLLALLILMIVCVYTHLPQFMDKETSLQTSESSSLNTQKVEEKTVEKIIEEAKTEELPKEEKIQEKSLESTEENKNEVLEDTSIEQVEEKIEENIEPLEPLIKTDKRYKRIGNEKNIEDLSRATQELQIKMSELVEENPIIFKKDSYKVTGKSDETVKKIADILIESPSIKIEVAGHTDASGAAKLNQAISKERAKGVRTRLISLGVESIRIKAKGYGESIPLEGVNKYSKKNRRVEFNIVEE